MKKFDLFTYLGQASDPEATTYQCGYYVINKYTNKIKTNKINDIFYTFIDNTLLRFEMAQYGDIQYFTVYEVKTFKDKDWFKIDSLILSREDIDAEIIPILLNLDNYNSFKLAIEDTALEEEIEKCVSELE